MSRPNGTVCCDCGTPLVSPKATRCKPCNMRLRWQTSDKRADRSCVECGAALASYSAERCKPCAQRLRFASEREGLGVPNESGLCMCGCGNPAPIAKQTNHRLGHIRGEAVCYISGHNYPRQITTWTVDPETGCWNWDGRWEGGYGRLFVDGRHVMAHRWVYEQIKGTILEGDEPDHLCRNQRCVNPDHLEPVSHAVNVQRGALAKLTAEDVVSIRALADTMTQVELASRFGVTQVNISLILRRKTWTNIP